MDRTSFDGPTWFCVLPHSAPLQAQHLAHLAPPEVCRSIDEFYWFEDLLLMALRGPMREAFEFNLFALSNSEHGKGSSSDNGKGKEIKDKDSSMKAKAKTKGKGKGGVDIAVKDTAQIGKDKNLKGLGYVQKAITKVVASVDGNMMLL